MDWLKAFVDYGVIGVLLLLSVVAVGVAVERWSCQRNTHLQSFTDRRALELHLTRKLHVIATIGANAPYIGLLGTVLGIMVTFSTIGQSGLVDSIRIMGGLALALKATAVGLLVAIPAVTVYNFLLRGVKERLLEWDIRHG